jgi:hypothetical protein
MNPIEYRLTLAYDSDIEKELIYRGNENITITIKSPKAKIMENEDISRFHINISRHILQKFLEIIE